MNNVLELLLTYTKIHVIEAYVNESMGYYHPFDLRKLDVTRFSEVRFYPNEMPVVYYETDRALKKVKEGKI